MSIITEKQLRSLTDRARFQRGQEYYQDGAVTGLRQYRGRTSATVAGSQDYRVNLWEEDGELEEEALHNMDDSDGHMHGIFERLQTLHLEACYKAKPDPQVLAECLFEWELAGEWDVFSGAAARYADVLGEPGLRWYRELARAEWCKVKPLTRAARRPADYEESHRRRRITHIMQALAQQTGDVEALVEVLRHDLSHPYSFLKIAEAYKGAGKADKALEWAERGISTFPDTPDLRLLEFVADEYHRLKRQDEAMGLMWQLFTDRPGLEQYRQLKQHASRCKQWSHWRKQALDHLLELLKNKPAKKTTSGNFYFSYAFGPRSVLVEIHLWENNVDAAWELARGGETHEELWLKLADKRAKQHPDDAIKIYRNQIESAVSKTNKKDYSVAVHYLKKIRTLMTQSDRENAFSSYLNTLRTTHKRKRSFIAMIEKL